MNSKTTVASTVSCKPGKENDFLESLVRSLPNFLGTAIVYVNFLLIKAINRSLSAKGSCRGYKRVVHVDVVSEVDGRIESDPLIRFAWNESQAATENFNHKKMLSDIEALRKFTKECKEVDARLLCD